jgi:hypothetical protein
VGKGLLQEVDALIYLNKTKFYDNQTSTQSGSVPLFHDGITHDYQFIEDIGVQEDNKILR